LTVAMCDSVSELAVIGAGLPRTGTLSVKAALEFLLGGPCYHGSLPFSGREGDQTVWREAFSTESIHPVLECGILRGFKAGVDHPFMCWYKELLELQPSAKVVLTVRDPECWYRSIVFLFSTINSLANTFPCSTFLSLVGLGSACEYARQNMVDTYGVSGKINIAAQSDKSEAIKIFNSHIEEVRSVVPKDQLLVFDVSEGWEPLCKFLGLPVPDIPFPNINDRQQVTTLCRIIQLISWGGLLGISLLFTCTLYYQTGGAGIILSIIVAAAILFCGGHTIRSLARTQATQKPKAD